jgi:hypothetical protein
MPFTSVELENIANAAIDLHLDRGKVKSQTLQDKPLLRAMRAKEKSFPGGKEMLDVRVKGIYSTTIEGFASDDEVSYGNPANIKKAFYPYKFIHSGIKFTMDEMVKDGISIVDTATGKSESRHSDREKTMLANLLDDKIEDMTEGTDRGLNEMYWRDGTQDALLIPGIRSFILDDPTSASIVGGIDQVANTWWRNRASLLIDTSTASNLNLVTTLQQEMRQLRRFGGRPNLFLCGSDFIDAFEKELRSKGDFTLSGWAKGGRIDASVADLAFKGIELEYDPTLDDEGLAKYGYVLDTRTIHPYYVEGENMKKHSPARPENKYVFYRALTHVGGLICKQRNANGVYSIL